MESENDELDVSVPCQVRLFSSADLRRLLLGFDYEHEHRPAG